MSPFKGQTGLKRILNATGYSFAGLKAAFKGEAAFRQLVLVNVILIPMLLRCPPCAWPVFWCLLQVLFFSIYNRRARKNPSHPVRHTSSTSMR